MSNSHKHEEVDYVALLDYDDAHVFIQLLSVEVADMLESHSDDELAEITDNLYHQLVKLVRSYDAYCLRHSLINHSTSDQLIAAATNNRLFKDVDGRIKRKAEA